MTWASSIARSPREKLIYSGRQGSKRRNDRLRHRQITDGQGRRPERPAAMFAGRSMAVVAPETGRPLHGPRDSRQRTFIARTVTSISRYRLRQDRSHGPRPPSTAVVEDRTRRVQISPGTGIATLSHRAMLEPRTDDRTGLDAV